MRNLYRHPGWDLFVKKFADGNGAGVVQMEKDIKISWKEIFGANLGVVQKCRLVFGNKYGIYKNKEQVGRNLQVDFHEIARNCNTDSNPNADIVSIEKYISKAEAEIAKMQKFGGKFGMDFSGEAAVRLFRIKDEFILLEDALRYNLAPEYKLGYLRRMSEKSKIAEDFVAKKTGYLIPMTIGGKPVDIRAGDIGWILGFLADCADKQADCKETSDYVNAFLAAVKLNTKSSKSYVKALSDKGILEYIDGMDGHECQMMDEAGTGSTDLAIRHKALVQSYARLINLKMQAIEKK